MMLDTTSILEDLHALVVDDDVDNSELMRFVLETQGLIVQTALSARQALDVVQSFQPDLLILDIALPGEDGYALLNQIRRMEPTQGGNAIAIAVTADVTQSLQRAVTAGFSRLFFKPVDMDEIVNLLVHLISQEENSRCTLPVHPIGNE